MTDDLRTRRRGGWELLLGVVLLSGLAVTVQVWLQARRADLRLESARFERLAELTGRMWQDHLRLVEGALASARGLVLGSRLVESDEWRRFAASLRERGGLPGVVELSFVVDLAGPEEALRPSLLLREHPGGSDAATDSDAFRGAALRARDTSTIAVAAPPPGRSVAHLLLPVYAEGVPPPLERRRVELRGWACASIDLDELVRTVVGADALYLRLRLVLAEPDAAGETLLDSAPDDPENARFAATVPVLVGDHGWTLRMTSRPAYEQAGGDGHLWILGVGVVLSVAIWLGGRAMVTARERAVRIAEVRGREMRVTEGRYREVFLGGAQAQLLVRPMDGRILDANPAATRYYGYDLERLCRMRLAELCSRGEDDAREIVVAADAAATARERRVRQRLSSGLVREVEVVACPIRVSGQTVIHASVRDVSERHEIERVQQITARVFETAAEAILVTDRSNRILMTNPSFTRISGYSSSEARGRDLGLLEAGLNPRPLLRDIQRALARDGAWVGEVCCRRKDGEVHPGRLAISELPEDGDRPERRVVVFSDLSASETAASPDGRVARYDPLTGLPDRALFLDRLERDVARARRDETGIGLLVVDLDGFRGINERAGHEAGDAALRAIADRVRRTVREADTVARLGGDEFAVVVSPVPREAIVDGVARRVRLAVREPARAGDDEIGLTGSIGIARYPDDGSDAEHLLRHAETALTRAKDDGGDRIRFFSTDSDRVARRRTESIGDLLRALDRGELLLHWQPVWCLRTGRIRGAEALLRWDHPRRGTIEPGRFLRDVSDPRVLEAVGSWVATAACERAADWSRRGLEIEVAFNVRGSELRDRAWLESLRAILASAGLPPLRVAVELDEATLLRQAGRLAPALRVLHDDGLAIHVDRAGLDEAVLDCLATIPVDRLKIDTACFVGRPSDDGRSGTIVAAARRRGIQVCGQDVETAERLRAVRDLEGELAQGYLLGRPVPADRFEADLATASMPS